MPTVTRKNEMPTTTRKTGEEGAAEAAQRRRFLSHRSARMRRPQAPTITSMASGTAEDPLATLRKRRPAGWPQPPEHPRVTIVRANLA
jgi:hypothetical protein